MTGRHRSRLQGFSAEFAEHREYVAGDDVRYVDWKVFGRSDRYFLKQFEDETNFSCWLVLDTSESMSYRSTGTRCSKLDHARRAAAALAWLALRQADAVGLVTVAGTLKNVLPPSTQPSHLQQIKQALVDSTATGPTGLGTALADLATRLTQPAMVICFSDLFADIDETTGGLEQVVEPRALAEAYRVEIRRFLDELSSRCRSIQVDYQLLRSDVPLADSLPRFLQARLRRRRRK